jgi:hypothetical protein
MEGLVAKRTRPGSGRNLSFDTEQSLNEYVAGPIVTQVKSHPALRDLSAKKFDVMEELTAITRGSVSAMAAAQ